MYHVDAARGFYSVSLRLLIESGALSGVSVNTLMIVAVTFLSVNYDTHCNCSAVLGGLGLVTYVLLSHCSFKK